MILHQEIGTWNGLTFTVSRIIPSYSYLHIRRIIICNYYKISISYWYVTRTFKQITQEISEIGHILLQNDVTELFWENEEGVFVPFTKLLLLYFRRLGSNQSHLNWRQLKKRKPPFWIWPCWKGTHEFPNIWRDKEVDIRHNHETLLKT